MRQNVGLALLITAFLTLLSLGSVFGQESEQPAAGQEESVATSVTEPQNQQWLWGEVVSLDSQKNELVVRYPDYDTDTEKEITICVNESTVYENVQSLGEIAPKDTVSIDYAIDAEGRNTAKNISVEKGEKQQPQPPIPEPEGAMGQEGALE